MFEIVNDALSNQSVHIVVAILASMMVGATLQPVPAQLSNLLTNSFLFKWAVVVVFTTRLFHPASDATIFRIMVIAAILLYALDLMRKQYV